MDNLVLEHAREYIPRRGSGRMEWGCAHRRPTAHRRCTGGALNTAPVAWLALGAAVRSVSPEVVATIAFLVVGGALTALGFAGYRRRDLTS